LGHHIRSHGSYADLGFWTPLTIFITEMGTLPRHEEAEKVKEWEFRGGVAIGLRVLYQRFSILHTLSTDLVYLLEDCSPRHYVPV